MGAVSGIMVSFNLCFALLPALLEVARAANIFAAHYSGTVNTLTLSSTNSLTLNTSLTIGGQPSWMTYDSSSRIIYVSDETSFGSGSISAVSAATNGHLSLLGKAPATGGGVANVLYGEGYVAIA